MDINIVYNKIVEKLKTSNNAEVFTGLESSLAGAATGSEALTASASYLLSLKYKNPEAYIMIKDLIKDYLEYCKDNGLIIK